MSSIKTSQLHEMARDRLLGRHGEHELIDIIMLLKDTVLNQRRELARVQRDYDEKKMQYEAVRDKLERVASSEGQEDQPAEPETWWRVQFNMESRSWVVFGTYLTTPLLHMSGERLAWQELAYNEDDAKARAVAAWKRAFGVEVEL